MTLLVIDTSIGGDIQGGRRTYLRRSVGNINAGPGAVTESTKTTGNTKQQTKNNTKGYKGLSNTE